MNSEHPHLRRAATVALFCGAASGAALLMAKSSRALRRRETRAARARRDLRQLDAAVDRYATELSDARSV